MNSTETQQITYLEAPELSEQNFSQIVTKVQTYRKGGIRLQHEQKQGKHIFHNYGHGTSGVSLAYGSVYLSVKSLYTYLEADTPIECAVLGSGLTALLTAIQLSKLGHSVTIYSDRFQQSNNSQKIGQSVNQIDQGLCLPFCYDSSDQFRYDLLAKLSYDFYKRCVQTNRYRSFRVITVYERDKTIQEISEKIPPFLFNDYKKENVSFGNGLNQKFIKLQTFKINHEVFASQLKIQAQLRGVKFVQKHFQVYKDILSLTQSCVFNTVGLSSKNLFNDQNMRGSVNYIAVFKNIKKLSYSLCARINNSVNLRVNCLGDQIFLRNQNLIENLNQNNSDGEIALKLIQEAKTFFENKTIKPHL